MKALGEDCSAFKNFFLMFFLIAPVLHVVLTQECMSQTLEQQVKADFK